MQAVRETVRVLPRDLDGNPEDVPDRPCWRDKIFAPKRHKAGDQVGSRDVLTRVI
jgi:hypothetical protein